MKRCPSCKFIYLDTDETCDFDGTRLEAVDENELEATDTHSAISPQEPPAHKSRRVITIAAAAALGLGVVLFLLYFAAAGKSRSQGQAVVPPVQLPTTVQVEATPTPLVSPSPLTEASPRAETERRSESQIPATRAEISRKPVSTGSQNGTQTGAVIRLSNGARIEADEVWRTRDGVWYRRNGMVTLLKASQVKGIEKTSRR